MIELHCHTTASDGLLTPEALVEAALERGVTLLAITDHDTTAGLEPARRAAAGRLEILAGVELSCRWRKRDFHLLGYGFDDADPGLQAVLAGQARHRQGRFQAMVDKLARLGMPLELPPDMFPGRAHLARALVAAGHVESVEEAFTRYLAQGKRAFVPGSELAPQPALEAVHGAGGWAVMAHPGMNGGHHLLDELARWGLDGLEAYHPRHAPDQVRRLEKAAARLGLFLTGGSDYHGTEGQKLGSVRPPADSLERLKCRRTRSSSVR